MEQLGQIFPLTSFSSVLFMFLLFFYLYLRQRKETADLYFSLVFLASAFFLLGEYFIYHLSDPIAIRFWQKFQNLGPLLLTVIFPLSIHQYLGTKNRHWLIISLTIPTIILTALLFPTDLLISNQKHLYSGEYEQFKEGPIYFIMSILTVFSILYSWTLLGFTVLKKKRTNAYPLLIGTSIAVLTALFDFTRIYLSFPFFIPSTFVYGIAIMNIFYGYSLLERFLRMYSRLEEDDKYIKALLSIIQKDITDLLEFVVTVIDKRDKYTADHSKNVFNYAIKLAKALNIPEREMKELRTASILHDIGKLGISDTILNKPGKLTEKEFDKIKKHPEIGAEILNKIVDLRGVVDHVKHHHERIDGKGYPDGLKGDQISRISRIIFVADTYDALTSDRPYRSGMNKESAFVIMDEVRGTQLESAFVDKFKEIILHTPLLNSKRVTVS